MRFFLFVFFFLILNLLSINFNRAQAAILFCAGCSEDCGPGFTDCLTDKGDVIQKSCNNGPCSKTCTPSWECNTGPCDSGCGGRATYFCNDGCGKTTRNTCTQPACPTPTPCNIRPETCGACSQPCGPGTSSCLTTCGTVVSQSCNLKACGITQTTQTCNSTGTAWTTSSACVTTCTPQAAPPPPTPDCNSSDSTSCGACSVACGVGTQQCTYVQSPGGRNCNPVAAPSQLCFPTCSSGFNCLGNVCQLANSIAGNVFIDTNSNTRKDAGEVNYTGTATFQLSTGATVNAAGGLYTFTNLLPGNYTVNYNNPPTGAGGYSMTIPPNGPPPFWTVIVGAGGSCSADGSPDGACDVNGSVINLNFGINNNKPWIQCKGADCRIDAGFTSEVPTTAIGGAYANLNGSGNTPGLIFTGNSTPNFGQGQPSSTGWVVGGPTYGETYTPTKVGGIVKTSYNYILAKAAQGNITPTDLAPFCAGGLSNCTLTFGASSHGVYRANGNLNLNAFTFPNGQNYVILVAGDMTINGRISVPTTSTVLFSATGNITVVRTVGEAVSSISPTIDGIYSADKSFIAQGYGGCSVQPDLRLNIAGSVITNAALAGGFFTNQRDLCANDIYYPTIYFTERLDMVLNTPDFLKQPNFTYQEIAP